MTQMRKSRGVVPSADTRLVNVVKYEYGTLKQTSTKRRSERNQSMRNHFLNTAKNLYERAKKAVAQDEVQRLASTSKLLHDFAQKMPSEPTLPELLVDKIRKQNDLKPKDTRQVLSQKPSRNKSKKDKDLDFDR